MTAPGRQGPQLCAAPGCDEPLPEQTGRDVDDSCSLAECPTASATRTAQLGVEVDHETLEVRTPHVHSDACGSSRCDEGRRKWSSRKGSDDPLLTTSPARSPTSSKGRGRAGGRWNELERIPGARCVDYSERRAAG